MKTDHPPSGLLRGLDLLIDADWTPERIAARQKTLARLASTVWRVAQLSD